MRFDYNNTRENWGNENGLSCLKNTSPIQRSSLFWNYFLLLSPFLSVELLVVFPRQVFFSLLFLVFAQFCFCFFLTGIPFCLLGIPKSFLCIKAFSFLCFFATFKSLFFYFHHLVMFHCSYMFCYRFNELYELKFWIGRCSG